MDFSFVNDAAPSSRQNGSTGNTVAPGTSTTSLTARRIQIPTLQQVQAAQQPVAAPSMLFRASSNSAPSRPPLQQPPLQQPQQHAAWQAPQVFMPHSDANKRQRLSDVPASASAPLGQASASYAPIGPASSIAAQGPQLSYQPQPASAARQPSPQLPSHASSPGHQQPFQQQPAHQHGAPQQPQLQQQRDPPQQQQQPASHQQQQPLGLNTILVSRRQQGNPVLKHVRNVRWQLADIVPDYLLGQNTAALFLSLRFQLLKPEYLMYRIQELQRAYRLVIVLCHIDVEDVVKPLAEVTRVALLNDCTLLCAWSAEECGRYLETLKAYETKPASGIQARIEHDHSSRLASALTSVRGINRTDAHTLGTTFGTLADIFRGSAAAFSSCPGLGPTKVRRLVETFTDPFRKVLREPHLEGDAADPAVTSTASGCDADGSGVATAPAASCVAVAGSAAGQNSLQTATASSVAEDASLHAGSAHEALQRGRQVEIQHPIVPRAASWLQQSGTGVGAYDGTLTQTEMPADTEDDDVEWDADGDIGF